jgi:hypothetical protein
MVESRSPGSRDLTRFASRQPRTRNVGRAKISRDLLHKDETLSSLEFCEVTPFGNEADKGRT